MLRNFKKNRENNRQKNFYKSLINKGDLCFDIGANVGKKSKIFLHLGGNVIGFEPQSSCVKELRKITDKNFKFIRLAVGSKNEVRELNLANHTEIATFSQEFIDYFETEEINWKGTEKVEVKTLNSLIETYGIPDFCKIDVEGYEWEILSVLTYEIPVIEFEFTGGFVKETLNIIELFENENCEFNVNLNEKPKFELGQWISGNKMEEKINSLPIKNLHGNIFVRRT